MQISRGTQWPSELDLAEAQCLTAHKGPCGQAHETHEGSVSEAGSCWRNGRTHRIYLTDLTGWLVRDVVGDSRSRMPIDDPIPVRSGAKPLEPFDHRTINDHPCKARSALHAGSQGLIYGSAGLLKERSDNLPFPLVSLVTHWVHTGSTANNTWRSSWNPSPAQAPVELLKHRTSPVQ